MRRGLHIRLRVAISIAIALAFAASPAVAGSCKSVLMPDTDSEAPLSFAATVVSLDGNAVVGYAHDFMTYHPKGEHGGEPGWWGNTGWQGSNGSAAQLFSNRLSGAGDDSQPFAVARRDLIDLAITSEDAPRVTITLRSWGNVRITFVADCGPDGMLHGAVIPRSDPARRVERVPTSFLILFRRSVCSLCG